MCGIVGYIGSSQAKPILLDGLKRLEYRGYDSAGLAFLQNGKFEIIRAEGKLRNLVEKTEKNNFAASIGIGHTRWATHGKPSEINAHPHTSENIVLVHNGIIENYLELKEDLAKKGHEFYSETDTEIICHLLQENLKSHKDFFETFFHTLKQLKGAYSLVIIHKESPNEIFIAKKGSPLVVGLGEGENFVASDIPALLPYTKQMIFLEDEELGVLTKDKVKIYDFNGQEIIKDIKTINWSAGQAEKDGYKHFMLKEIMEQPRSLTDTLRGRIDQDKLSVNLEGADSLLEQLSVNPDFKIHIIACGTSYHAGLTGSYWIESLAKVPTRVELASEFRYREPLIDENTLIVPISQSGETADTLAALKAAKQKGSKVLSICNVIESSIPRASDATLYTNAGPEIGVASTKAFTTQMTVLYLLALKLSEIKKTIDEKSFQERVDSLLKLPNLYKAYLRDLDVTPFTELIYKKEHCYYLGRGIQYPIVLEGALKLKEISYVHAEGYPGGEMKHGPIALIEEGIPVVSVVVKDHLYEKMVSNIEEVQARGAETIALISEGDEMMQKQFKHTITVPNTHEDLLPFLTVLPMQLISYYVADQKGTDVDQPRNLAKSVTVE